MRKIRTDVLNSFGRRNKDFLGNIVVAGQVLGNDFGLFGLCDFQKRIVKPVAQIGLDFLGVVAVVVLFFGAIVKHRNVRILLDQRDDGRR